MLMQIKLTKKNKIVLGVGVSLVIVLLIYSAMQIPLMKDLKVKTSEYKALEADVTGAKRIIGALKIENKMGALASGKDVLLAIDELTELGKKQGIRFVSITPSEPKGEELSEAVTVNIEMVSTYKDMGVFLGSLDNLEKSLVTVSGFAMRPTERDPDKLKSALTLNMHFLYKK
jgi:Tfp pilus assembly protein PilO